MALLVLPGPGLLLMLAGLILLANAFPAVQRFVAPARTRAMQAMRESVATPLRLAFSVGTWGPWPNLPLGGWPTGMSLILSGLILLGLLVVTNRYNPDIP